MCQLMVEVGVREKCQHAKSTPVRNLDATGHTWGTQSHLKSGSVFGVLGRPTWAFLIHLVDGKSHGLVYPFTEWCRAAKNVSVGRLDMVAMVSGS